MQVDFYQMILSPPVYRVAVPQDVEKVSGLTLGSSEPELCIGVCVRKLDEVNIEWKSCG